MTTEPVLALDNLSFGWTAETTLIAIDRFALAPGESLFLRGPSGSGKSTLLGLIGGVLTPRTGSIHIQGTDIVGQSSAARDRIRADHLGIIFQQFNLLPYLSVLGNVTLPCRFSKQRRARSRESYPSPAAEARALIESLGLPADILTAPVGELSVGQQQRVAVARALIGGPDLIIADEPTSALDADNRDRFIELLNSERQRFGTALLFVSHDGALAKHFDRKEDLPELNQGLNQNPNNSQQEMPA